MKDKKENIEFREVSYSACTAIAEQISSFLLNLGIREPHDKLFDGIKAELRGVNLNQPEYKEVFSKVIPIGFSIISPMFQMVNLTLEVTANDRTGVVVGNFCLSYEYKTQSNGKNGHAAIFHVIPTNGTLNRLDYTVVDDIQFRAVLEITKRLD